MLLTTTLDEWIVERLEPGAQRPRGPEPTLQPEPTSQTDWEEGPTSPTFLRVAIAGKVLTIETPLGDGGDDEGPAETADALGHQCQPDGRLCAS